MHRKLGNGTLCSLEWTARPDICLGETRSRVAARGTLRVRILDTETLLASLGGTDAPDRMEKRVTRAVLDRLTEVLDRQVHRPEELDSRFNEVATEARLGLKHRLSRMGLDLVDFTILGLGLSARNRRRAAAARSQSPRRSAVPGSGGDTRPTDQPGRLEPPSGDKRS